MLYRVSWLFMALAASGCATPPSMIEAANVSESPYAQMDCAALKTAYSKALQSSLYLSSIQQGISDQDVIGVALLGLPVGSMSMGRAEREAMIARHKGEARASRHVATQKSCPDVQAW